MTWLLDGNVLIALVLDTHEFHQRATRWFVSHDDAFATCVVTQGTLLRLHMRLAADGSAQAAWDVLRRLIGHPRHVYFEDGFSYQDIDPTRLHSSSHVTDAWLAQLAARRQCFLTTFDVSLTKRHDRQARLVPLVG